MKSSLAIALAASLSACSPCEEGTPILGESEATAPGAVRGGRAFGPESLYIAPHGDGSLLCVGCAGVVGLDASLDATGRFDASEPRRFTAAPDGTMYIVLGSVTTEELVAVSPDGRERWRVALPGVPGDRLAATAEAVYLEVQQASASGLAVAAFDAASGALRWSRADQALLGAGDAGAFTVAHGEHALTLRLLAPTGTPVWEHLATSEGLVFRANDAVQTPEGHAIIVGRTEAPIAFADRVLDLGDDASAGFAVEIDATGATRWAFANDVISNESVALASSGDILLAGLLDVTGPTPAEVHADGFLALATPAGVARTHRIGGRGSQQVGGVEAAADGAAWVQVDSFADEELPDPTVQIGTFETDEHGAFVFLVVP